MGVSLIFLVNREGRIIIHDLTVYLQALLYPSQEKTKYLEQML